MDKLKRTPAKGMSLNEEYMLPMRKFIQPGWGWGVTKDNVGQFGILLAALYGFAGGLVLQAINECRVQNMHITNSCPLAKQQSFTKHFL